MGNGPSLTLQARWRHTRPARVTRSKARTSVRQSTAVRSFAAVPSPWGSDTWRYDKNSFLAWCMEATANKDYAARRELYGMLAMRFGDTDAQASFRPSSVHGNFVYLR